MSGTIPDTTQSAPVPRRDVVVRFVPVDERDFSVPFLSDLGTIPNVNSGICYRCRARKRIGDFCFHCCTRDGLVMVTCHYCQDIGPIGISCQYCGEGDYGIENVREAEQASEEEAEAAKETKEEAEAGEAEEPTDEHATSTGSCPECHHGGIRGCLCSDCEDMAICYE